MENLKYSKSRNENNEVKCLNNTQRNKFLKVKNSVLELENDIIGLKDGELQDRELKIKKEIIELFLKPIIISVDDMDRFE